MTEWNDGTNPVDRDLTDQERASRHGERGFILAQSALLLIPLLIFAAFATDIGSWYVQGHKAQRGADAAALAGVTFLPDVAAAEQVARAAAARNGFVDATPGDNTDFDTGPLPQVRITTFGAEGLEVEIKTEAPAYFGQIVMDSIEVERYGVAEYIQPVHLGNPTSGLGTGNIDPTDLGLPNDSMWLSINGYCSDHEQGDPFSVGYYNGTPGDYTNCSPAGVHGNAVANPTYNNEGYIFIAEYQPGSPPIDIDVYEPGTDCGGGADTGDNDSGPILNFEVFGPSNTIDHVGYINANAPIWTQSFPRSACISNGAGTGWWSIRDALPTPSAIGGYYYVRVSARNPGSTDVYPTDDFWDENSINNFSLRVTRSGENLLCAFSVAQPTCPQLYALDWLPLFRKAPQNDEAAFYLAEVSEDHAGEKMVVTFFDAAEGIDNVQFADSNNQAMPFEWRYTDQLDGNLTGGPYLQTSLAPHPNTCSWNSVGGNPCLLTSNGAQWNDHFVQVEIDIPDNYTCGADCWWTVRYTTGVNSNDRSAWSIVLEGDPVRLVE